MSDKEGGKTAFFDLDGTKFRRRAGVGYRSVDDVLVDGKWTPYEGNDALKPAVFGNEIEDPLGS